MSIQVDPLKLTCLEYAINSYEGDDVNDSRIVARASLFYNFVVVEEEVEMKKATVVPLLVN